MNKVLVDTNILIYLNKNNSFKIDSFLYSNKIYMADISFNEFSIAFNNKEDYSLIIHSFERIQFDSKIKGTAKAIQIKYQLSVNDAIIAATAYCHQLPLFTLDKAFKNLKEIKLYTYDF